MNVFKNFTRDEIMVLSKKSGVSERTIYRLKNDEKYNPTKETLEKIAKAMNKDPSEFFEKAA